MCFTPSSFRSDLRSFIISALGANKIINTRRKEDEKKREVSGRFGRRRRAFCTCKVEDRRPLFYFFSSFSSSSSSSSFASRFPSFPNQVHLLHPLTMPRRALHTTRLFLQGVFSRECRESTHIGAHVDAKFVRVFVCSRTPIRTGSRRIVRSERVRGEKGSLRESRAEISFATAGLAFGNY